MRRRLVALEMRRALLALGVVGICSFASAIGAGAENARYGRIVAVAPPCQVTVKWPLQQLWPGKYVVLIRDRSTQSSFRLKGPGVARHTTAGFVGEAKWLVRLYRGRYRYFCYAPRASGSLIVP